jgi:phosphoglucosamine mutase
MQVLSVVKRRNLPVSEVCRRFEPLPQILKNVRAPRPRLEADTVVSAIDKARTRLGDKGRLVIRPSGTEPVIRVMGEGDNRALIEEIVGDVCDALKVPAEAA